ncbi:hypothetical protein AN964_09655 [Heyndrickxia shackletonii]|uniref:Uncharacterized protein n=1 Tax=Heyndrickxia shackletonii TaxID=157838 RepID=A0A0Q3WXJ6_9BACI|nr:Hsp20/alpha crystallin family protein [Heyndrickxia shackletonii]KQL53740.1 hypothetical protein AN964_09655 [Heyndrickxia shackletonii]MBB2481701.1 Hsp20/alpha crystallin family protein [Bacillus sp. APMAM]NEY99884.1 Hsp20/alpha crystallin family protein [Heyndrickxia shackletonii]RTZ54989.1 Hsp20/alpha crystallin family protein [Bacillus sp. SAJ1]
MSEKPDKMEKNSLHDPFQGLMRSMNNIFQEPPVKGFLESIDEFFSAPFPFSAFPVELNETDKEYIITAKLSGVKKDQINIDIFQQYITISVENVESTTQENQNQKSIFKKSSMQRSSRTIPLTKPINEAKVKANYEDGLLTIHVPKENGKRLRIE